MDIEYVLSIIFHIFFVSVPEQLFLILFSLILINRQELFTKLNKQKVLKLAVMALVPAVISVLMRAINGLDMSLLALIGITIVFVTIALGYNIRGARKIGILLGAVIMSFICEIIIQLIYTPLVLYGTSVSVNALNQPGFLTFVWLLPERAIETLLIMVMLLNKSSVYRIKLYKVIWDNKFLAWAFMILVTMDFAIIYWFAKSILLDKILIELKPLIQISVVAYGILIPVTSTSLFLVITYIFAEHKVDEKAFMCSEAKVLKELINLLIKEGRYKEIPEVMNDYNLLVENCSEYLQRKGLKI